MEGMTKRAATQWVAALFLCMKISALPATHIETALDDCQPVAVSLTAVGCQDTTSFVDAGDVGAITTLNTAVDLQDGNVLRIGRCCLQVG